MPYNPTADDPNEPDLPPLLRARVEPSLTGWMDWLSLRIDDAMLAEIAAADYGYRADAYLVDLRHIRDERRIPVDVAELPLEVLELVRWSEPDDPAWQPGGHGERGHLMRLFCCAVLVAVADNPTVRQYAEEEPTLRQLVASAVALGPEAVDTLLPLLCWRVPTLPAIEAEDRPFFAMSILLLVAANDRAVGDGPLLVELCRWVIAEETRYRAIAHPSLIHDGWLLGLKFSSDGVDQWRDLAWRLLIDPPTPHPPSAAAALHDIGTRIVLGVPEGSSDDPRLGLR